MSAQRLISYRGSSGRVRVDHNEVPAFPEFRSPLLREWTLCDKSEACKYCNAALQQKHLADVATDDVRVRYRVRLCTRCGWWEIWISTVWLGGYSDSTLVSAVKNFDINDERAPIRELREYLRKHPKSLAIVHPKAFERLCESLVRSHFPGAEVYHCGKSGDGGVDVIAVTGETTWLIQAKRRENMYKPEGIEVVRTMKGVFFEYEQTGRFANVRGMIISTAQTFTSGAQKSAAMKDVRVAPMDSTSIELKSFEDIVYLLGRPDLEPYEPWVTLLSAQFPDDYRLIVSPTTQALKAVFKREIEPPHWDVFGDILGGLYWPQCVRADQWQVRSLLDGSL